MRLSALLQNGSRPGIGPMAGRRVAGRSMTRRGMARRRMARGGVAGWRMAACRTEFPFFDRLQVQHCLTSFTDTFCGLTMGGFHAASGHKTTGTPSPPRSRRRIPLPGMAIRTDDLSDTLRTAPGLFNLSECRFGGIPSNTKDFPLFAAFLNVTWSYGIGGIHGYGSDGPGGKPVGS